MVGTKVRHSPAEETTPTIVATPRYGGHTLSTWFNSRTERDVELLTTSKRRSVPLYYAQSIV